MLTKGSIGRLSGALDLAETARNIQSITILQPVALDAADADHVNSLIHNELDDLKE